MKNCGCLCVFPLIYHCFRAWLTLFQAYKRIFYPWCYYPSSTIIAKSWCVRFFTSKYRRGSEVHYFVCASYKKIIIAAMHDECNGLLQCHFFGCFFLCFMLNHPSCSLSQDIVTMKRVLCECLLSSGTYYLHNKIPVVDKYYLHILLRIYTQFTQKTHIALVLKTQLLKF